MRHPGSGSPEWIFSLTAGFLYAAAVLRALLLFRGTSLLAPVLGLLLTGLGLFLLEPHFSRRWPGTFAVYLSLQALLVMALLSRPADADFFAILFAVLSMQAMQRLPPRHGAVIVGLFAPLTALPLADRYGAAQALLFGLIFTAANVILGAYALATRRARSARGQARAVAARLRESNRQLQNYALRVERLASARERARLARELHDSVTQTIFSMTLASQSAVLLLDRDPARVGAQLDRLTELARGALSEMQVLISELRPETAADGGLAAALRRHLAERALPEGLSIRFEAEGDCGLSPAEQQGLFRIAQEALNNVVKHSGASEAFLRLHLTDPAWMEIEDRGRGFERGGARTGGGLGLESMGERASEIGWRLRITSAPGRGTRVRVERGAAERSPA